MGSHHPRHLNRTGWGKWGFSTSSPPTSPTFELYVHWISTARLQRVLTASSAVVTPGGDTMCPRTVKYTLLKTPTTHTHTHTDSQSEHYTGVTVTLENIAVESFEVHCAGRGVVRLSCGGVWGRGSGKRCRGRGLIGLSWWEALPYMRWHRDGGSREESRGTDCSLNKRYIYIDIISFIYL